MDRPQLNGNGYRPNNIATDCHLFYKFFTVREVDLIVLSALWKKLLIFVREVYTSRILGENGDLCDVYWLASFTVIAVVEHFHAV